MAWTELTGPWWRTVSWALSQFRQSFDQTGRQIQDQPGNQVNNPNICTNFKRRQDKRRKTDASRINCPAQEGRSSRFKSTRTQLDTGDTRGMSGPGQIETRREEGDTEKPETTTDTSRHILRDSGTAWQWNCVKVWGGLGIQWSGHLFGGNLLS